MSDSAIYCPECLKLQALWVLERDGYPVYIPAAGPGKHTIIYKMTTKGIYGVVTVIGGM